MFRRLALMLVIPAIAAPWLGCSRSASLDATRAGGDAPGLTVGTMTFNIRHGLAQDGPNHWNLRKELVRDTIAQSGCDVIGLQEARIFQVEYLVGELGNYEPFGTYAQDGKSGGESVAILYNKDRFDRLDGDTFWFSDTPTQICSATWGNELCRICTWVRLRDRSTGQAFYVYNVHLDHRSQPSREKSAQLLAKRIAEREHAEPFVAMGDFNAGEDNPAMVYLRGEGQLPGTDILPQQTPVVMHDTFRLVLPNVEDVGTFSGFTGRRDGNKIDHIFVPDGVETQAADIWRIHWDERYPSDHYPVRATIRLGQTGG
ncbi:MAG: endonuclease/exonuclease/phosphatase family protein [Sedimentisphaerales bacterium]|nr:endonuclease/exonuclease/phosphatase family protein [Sedimentisphaerales bacterium]